MNLSPAGIALIKEFEGCKLQAYLCSAGVPTVGYGHTGPEVKVGMTITQERADRYFTEDVKRFEDAVLRECSSVKLSQNEFDALCSFTYNVGVGNLQRSMLLVRLKAGDKAAAAGEFMRWRKAGGKIIPGLVRRRDAERAMFLGVPK